MVVAPDALIGPINPLIPGVLGVNVSSTRTDTRSPASWSTQVVVVHAPGGRCRGVAPGVQLGQQNRTKRRNHSIGSREDVVPERWDIRRADHGPTELRALRAGAPLPDPAGFDSRQPSSFASGLGQGAMHEHEAPNIDQSEYEGNEDGEDEGELDHRLTATPAPAARDQLITFFTIENGPHDPLTTVSLAKTLLGLPV